MSNEKVKKHKKHEFLGVILYVIGALCFSFIPLAIDIPYSLAVSIPGLVILLIGFVLIVKR